MGNSAIRVIIDRPLAGVFVIYAQPDPWSWAGMRSVRWTSGKPWEVDSRMALEPANAFGVIVDQVLTHFEANRRVEFISHFGGITLLTHVRFRALSENQTEIRSDLEFMGTFSRVAGFAVGPAIEKGAQTFYDLLKRECELVIPPATPPSAP
jgi:hypothetical protein